MNIELITIENLKCGGCANSIRQALNKITGVEEVKVGLENSTVSIKHNGVNDRATFIDRLSSLGYPERGNSTFAHKAKSYVSCAIGRLK